MRFCSPRLGFVSLLFSTTVCFAQTIVAPPAVFPSGVSTPLGQQIAAITNEPGVVRAHWGIAITALDGTPIYGMNQGEFFRPASNAKLFTTAAAMHLLGPDTKVSTVATLKTPIKPNGIIEGDI